MNRIPMSKIIDGLATGEQFYCSPLVFALVNRTLNDHGYHAVVNAKISTTGTDLGNGLCRFTIGKMEL
jgi:hypothetical protein